MSFVRSWSIIVIGRSTIATLGLQFSLPSPTTNDGLPQLTAKNRNETVVLDAKRRTEVMATDCYYKEMKSWEEWRNSGRSSK